MHTSPTRRKRIPGEPDASTPGDEMEDGITLGSIVGSATGEGDRDVAPGGWSGTEDATSTAPSDLMGISLSPDGGTPVPDIERMGDDLGDISDLQETDAEEKSKPVRKTAHPS